MSLLFQQEKVVQNWETLSLHTGHFPLLP
jgi:hypothetical protein